MTDKQSLDALMNVRDRFLFIHLAEEGEQQVARLTELLLHLVGLDNTIGVGTWYAPVEECGRDDADQTSPMLRDLSDSLSGSGLTGEHYFSAHYRIIVFGPKAHTFSKAIPVLSFSQGSVVRTLFCQHPLVIVTHDSSLSELPFTRMVEEEHSCSWNYWHKAEGMISSGGQEQHRSFFSKRYQAGVKPGLHLSGMLPDGVIRTVTYKGSDMYCFELEEFLQSYAERISSGFHIEKAPVTSPGSDLSSSPFLRVDHIGIVSKFHRKIGKFIELFSGGLLYEGIVPQIGVSCRYFDAGNIELELVTPAGDDSIVSKHYEEAGRYPIHHIAFEVSDLELAVSYLKDKGYYPIRDDTYLAPKPFHQVIFLSPVQTGGLLIELVCDSGGKLPQYGERELSGH